MNFCGRRTLVNGASQGIGRTIALALADQGASVALAARRDDIYDVASEIGEDRALSVEPDVTEEDSVRSTVDEVVDTFGGLDYLGTTQESRVRLH